MHGAAGHGPHRPLAVATLAFLGAHFVSSTPLRGELVGAIGERGYLAVYRSLAFAPSAG